jgi:large subunit ribosomal protein L10
LQPAFLHAAKMAALRVRAMKKDEKQKQAEALREELAKAKGVLLSSFEGITVAQDTDLRAKVARAGGKYRVVKNSLIERAAQGTPVEPVAKKLRGTTSLAYTNSDPVALAKVITSYAKENPILVFKTGMVESRVIALADLNAVASLPSREMLLSKVLFLIKSPAQRAASTLAGVARNLAYVIQQGVQQNRFQGTGDRGQGPEPGAGN